MKKKKPKLTVEAEVIPFGVKFTETKEGMEIEIIDDLNMVRFKMIEEKKEDIFESNFNMYDIGKFVIKTLKPKFREIIKQSQKI